MKVIFYLRRGMESRILFVLLLLITISSNSICQSKSGKAAVLENVATMLDTVWETEQTPIRRRDSLLKIYGAESPEYQKEQDIYEKNHHVNEAKITLLLDTYGWPSREVMGHDGNLTIANVIQHSDNTIRLKYLPMMRQAVMDGKLEARFLVRAEDRIATDRGDLQIYGGQMKYYPKTKSFNLWPVYDPANVDKRRAEIGLQPIADFLQQRFDFEWNLKEQIKRSEEFVKEKEEQEK